MLVLNISSQPLKLNINSYNAALSQQSTRPRLEITSEAAKLELHQPQGILEIDETPCRASYGIKNQTEFAKDNAELGKETALETIGKISEDGDRLANIGSGENAIAALAAESSFTEPPEIGLIPIAAPNINYTPQPVEANYIPGQFTMNVEPGRQEGEYQPARVDIQVAQYNSIRFWTTENKVDIAV